MTEQIKKRQAIRQNILFADIADTFLEQIVDLFQSVAVKKGTIIYHQGGDIDGLYLVASGEVAIFTERDHEKYTLSHAQTHYLFGEFLLHGRSVRSTSAQATVDSNLLFLERYHFDTFFERFPEQKSMIAARIAHRLYWNQTTLALRLSRLFVGLNEEIVRSLINHMEFQSIPSNTVLIKQNAVSDAMWIVIDGQFQVSKLTNDGDYQKLAVLGRGETIGEIGVSCDTPRRSDVKAIRDSTVAKLTRPSFETILRQYPVEINRTFITSVVGHLQRNRISKIKSAETFALVFLSTHLNTEKIATQLVQSLAKYGTTTALTSQQVDIAFNQTGLAQSSFEDHLNKALLQWLSEQEIAHRHLIYILDNDLSNWSKRCLRQADHIIFCVDAQDSPAMSQQEQVLLAEIGDKDIKQTLILIHPDTTTIPSHSSHWLENRTINIHHHIKLSSIKDYQRVSRFLTGNAVGLVLGGGAARGFAHVGVMRAFKELNIPIDLIGGNSMGAVIAAQYAMQWDFDQMIERTQQLCLQGDRFTVPVISIFSGNRMTQGLKKMFADSCIEDLWRHFFSISCNISRATVMTHQQGSLLSAVLNSNAPPGLFPPQVIQGDLLVDGALLNNVPVDVMAKINEGGHIIAVDINAREDLLGNTDNIGGINGWQLLINKLNPFGQKINFPNLIEILTRASIIGGLAQRKKLITGVADLYLQPPVNHFPLMGYKHAKAIEQAGYDYAIKALQKWQTVSTIKD